MSVEPATRAIYGARWTVGRLGFVAGTLPYLQAVLSEEAKSKAGNDPQLRCAIVAHQTLYAHNIAIQLANIMDKRREALSPKQLEGLRCGNASQEVYRYAAAQHPRVGGSLTRSRFDDLIDLVGRRMGELRKTQHCKNVLQFRDEAVAHMTISDYRTSFADMAEFAFDAFGIGDILQSIFKNGVDQRNFTDLYREHLACAVQLYGLSQPLEPIFTRKKIALRGRL